jgi:hypothetical protein
MPCFYRAFLRFLWKYVVLLFRTFFYRDFRVSLDSLLVIIDIEHKAAIRSPYSVITVMTTEDALAHPFESCLLIVVLAHENV